MTDKQKRLLREWVQFGNKKKQSLDEVFDDLGTVLDHDVYLYRGVCVRPDLNASKQCNFLNSIVEGGIIDNGTNYNATATNINKSYDFSGGFGQYYVLKIKVPKGTKVMDMRHYYKSGFDEIVLPPCKYKVNHIDYATGIVDCDFIPN